MKFMHDDGAPITPAEAEIAEILSHYALFVMENQNDFPALIDATYRRSREIAQTLSKVMMVDGVLEDVAKSLMQQEANLPFSKARIDREWNELPDEECPKDEHPFFTSKPYFRKKAMWAMTAAAARISVEKKDEQGTG